MINLNAENGYKLPPENITRIFDTAPFPVIKFIPFGEIGIEYTYQRYKTLEEISLNALPFVFVSVLVVFIIAYFPALTLWLPNFLGTIFG